MSMPSVAFLLAVILGCGTALTQAAESFITVYASRYYPSDERLYSDFVQKTGIQVRRSEGEEEDLFANIIKPQRGNPGADVLLAMDGGILSRAEQLGLLDPLKSEFIEARVPEHLRTASWTAFTTRARVIVYNKEAGKAEEVQNYADLAHPRLKGRLCSRSGRHPYSLTLLASVMAHEGEERAEQWVRGVVANLARGTSGDDIYQIRAVAEGDPCEFALVNSYYLAHLMGSVAPEDQKLARRIGIVWPNQAGVGTHINVSGAGVVATSLKKDAALKFIEYLVADEAQRYLANVNNEWPVVASIKVKTPGLDALGEFKPDSLSVGQLAEHQAVVKKIVDRAGFR
jgi:iron(III) transport system substrate-binding protein